MTAWRRLSMRAVAVVGLGIAALASTTEASNEQCYAAVCVDSCGEAMNYCTSCQGSVRQCQEHQSCGPGQVRVWCDFEI